MNRLTVTPVVVERFDEVFEFEHINDPSIPDGGAEVSMAQDNQCGLLLCFHSAINKGTVTIKAGNGIQGVGDLQFEVVNGKSYYIVPETGRFKNMSGPDKGKIVIESNVEGVKVSAYLLPLK